jgi:hypothetical protein
LYGVFEKTQYEYYISILSIISLSKAGNGLILHSALAIEPQKGQSIGLLWQKLWNREPKQKPPKNETPTQKKKRQAAARVEARKRPFEVLNLTGA